MSHIVVYKSVSAFRNPNAFVLFNNVIYVFSYRSGALRFLYAIRPARASGSDCPSAVANDRMRPTVRLWLHGAWPPAVSGGIPAHLTFPLAFLYAMCMPLGSTRSLPTATTGRLPRCPHAKPLEVPRRKLSRSNPARPDRRVPLHCHQRDACRRNRIVSQLVCLGAATVAELAAALDLSERTIHRAVKARQRAGEAPSTGSAPGAARRP